MWWVGQRPWNFQQILVLVLAFKENVLPSFLLFLSVCWWPKWYKRSEIACSMTRNFNNSWLLYVKFSETINLCRNIWLIENWKCWLFFFWKKRRQRGQHFQFFKGQFLRNAWPYGYDFWRVFRDLCEASNKYNFAVFFKI